MVAAIFDCVTIWKPKDFPCVVSETNDDGRRLKIPPAGAALGLRSAFDRIVEAGGYISVSTGSAPEANSIPVAKNDSDLAMDAAACIGCGACVAACPNGSASLFTAAKISHLTLLPQGQPERERRVMKMVEAMDREHFGNCTMHRECEAVCPKIDQRQLHRAHES